MRKSIAFSAYIIYSVALALWIFAICESASYVVSKERWQYALWFSLSWPLLMATAYMIIEKVTSRNKIKCKEEENAIADFMSNFNHEVSAFKYIFRFKMGTARFKSIINGNMDTNTGDLLDALYYCWAYPRFSTESQGMNEYKLTHFLCGSCTTLIASFVSMIFLSTEGGYVDACERIILPWLTYLALYTFGNGVHSWADLNDGEVRKLVGMARSLLVANGLSAPKDSSKLQVSYQDKDTGPGDGVCLQPVATSCFIKRKLKVKIADSEMLNYEKDGFVYNGERKMVGYRKDQV